MKLPSDPVQGPQPGYTGFDIRMSATIRPDQPPEVSQPIISSVHPGTPAARAGLATGDVILDVNGVDSRRGGALFPIVGTAYVVRVKRGDEEREFSLIPVPKPPSTK
jgi:S1-C subfamily serine protease